jgi:hypothetical protein
MEKTLSTSNFYVKSLIYWFYSVPGDHPGREKENAEPFK